MQQGSSEIRRIDCKPDLGVGKIWGNTLKATDI